MDEFSLIAEIFAPLATADGAFGLKDDAAVLPARAGFDLVITTDTIAEGTDFFPHDPAGSVAQKALRVNLSDLAAKGAAPEFYLLSLSLPQGITREWLEAFAAGLALDQKNFGISLLGGDTSRSEGPLAIAVTALGFVPTGQMLRRGTARAGDAVYVTGCIGDSGGGLAIFKREKHTLDEIQRDRLIARYRLPQPPIAFSAALREMASAGIDISDGLVADLGHIAKASGVAIVIDAQAVPRSDALRALWGDSDEAIIRAVTSGDDYQIAFTADPQKEADILAAATKAAATITRIGAVTEGEGVALCQSGRALDVPRPGWRHF